MLTNLLFRLAPPAQLVSVWRHDLLRYDYYVVPKNVALRPPPPTPGRPAFGEALEVLMPGLPQAATKVGFGPQARGTLVVDRSGHGGSRGLGALIGTVLDKLEV